MENSQDLVDILEKLKSGASRKKISSLEIINAVCKEQIERGSKNLTIAMVGRLSSTLGDPSEQAIRNASGKAYQILIEEWRKRHVAEKTVIRKINSEFRWIEDIDKPNIRWHAEDFRNRFIMQRNELNLIKQITEFNIDMRPIKSTNSTERGLSLSDIERRAIEHCISDENLEVNGWRIDERGQILGPRNNQVFKPGFSNAIRKILDSH